MWSVASRIDLQQDTKPVVMKLMKQKHDVTQRNLERHQRDAIVMEQLTSSQNVVHIYGFCGNTVVTEFLSTPLDVVTDGLEIHRPTTTTTSSSTVHPITRQTPEGRLHLMLEATKGLRDIHGISGGPIVHADIGARQFLVRDDGKVALNDFNRCRFVAHRNNNTHEPCSFLIPSAPGKSRSPEEYIENRLNEKLDVFSLGNVYYTILYGYHPWEAFSSRETKSLVKQGTLPTFKKMESPIDQKLIEIAKKTFIFEPDLRPSASQLLQELEALKNEAVLTDG